MALSQLPQIEWLDPWHGQPGTPGVPGLEQELQREVGPRHRLYHLAGSAVAVARRLDQDDVLFAITEGTDAILLLAEVHLTWSGQQEVLPNTPATLTFASIQQWRNERMLPDHEQWRRIIEERHDSETTG